LPTPAHRLDALLRPKRNLKENARDRTTVSTSEPTQTQERFAAIVEALADKQGVTVGSPRKKGFGSSALQVDGKIF
jgi:hypothetical protein